MATILQHGMLIDGLTKEPVTDGMLIYEGKEILYAGPFCPEAAAQYPGAQVLDVRGQTIMPGLIDAHVHLTMYGKPSSVMDFLMDSATYTALKAADCAKKLLYAGFTTVRSMGDKASADYAVKRAINEGMIEGPRLLTSGKAISITGGHGDFVPGDVELDSIGETCDGVDEVRRAARDRLKNGADNIKLMATGGGNSPGPGTVSQLTEEEMRVAVEEAANRNALTAAHAIGADGIKRALRAGVRTIEHGSFLDDEGIELLLKGDHYLVPTLCAFRTIKYGPEGGVPDYVLEKNPLLCHRPLCGAGKGLQSGREDRLRHRHRHSLQLPRRRRGGAGDVYQALHEPHGSHQDRYQHGGSGPAPAGHRRAGRGQDRRRAGGEGRRACQHCPAAKQG